MTGDELEAWQKTVDRIMRKNDGLDTIADLSRRDFFAGLSMHAIQSREDISHTMPEICKAAVYTADMLIDELNKVKDGKA